jgi:hypothetical protein
MRLPTPLLRVALYTFVPVSYFTGDVVRARNTAIIVAVVVAVVLSALGYVAIDLALRQLYDLSVRMEADPWAATSEAASDTTPSASAPTGSAASQHAPLGVTTEEVGALQAEFVAFRGVIDKLRGFIAAGIDGLADDAGDGPSLPAPSSAPPPRQRRVSFAEDLSGGEPASAAAAAAQGAASDAEACDSDCVVVTGVQRSQRLFQNGQFCVLHVRFSRRPALLHASSTVAAVASSADQLARFVRAAAETACDIVSRSGLTLVDFVGDAMMCCFRIRAANRRSRMLLRALEIAHDASSRSGEPCPDPGAVVALRIGVCVSRCALLAGDDDAGADAQQYPSRSCSVLGPAPANAVRLSVIAARTARSLAAAALERRSQALPAADNTGSEDGTEMSARRSSRADADAVAVLGLMSRASLSSALDACVVVTPSIVPLLGGAASLLPWRSVRLRGAADAAELSRSHTLRTACRPVVTRSLLAMWRPVVAAGRRPSALDGGSEGDDNLVP